MRVSLPGLPTDLVSSDGRQMFFSLSYTESKRETDKGKRKEQLLSLIFRNTNQQAGRATQCEYALVIRGGSTNSQGLEFINGAVT